MSNEAGRPGDVTEGNRSRITVTFLSVLIPGAGQITAGRRRRGAAIFLTVFLCGLIVAWHDVSYWYVIPALVWLWGVWDAYGVAHGWPRAALVPVLCVLALAYGIGWNVAGVDPGALTRNINRAGVVLGPMVRPDLIALRTESQSVHITVEVPCSESPPERKNSEAGLKLVLSAGCARAGQELAVRGEGFWPGVPGDLWWEDTIGERARILEQGSIVRVWPNEEGAFSTEIIVPQMRTGTGQEANLDEPLPERLIVVQERPIGGLQITENGYRVIDGILETISMALMATTLAVFSAVPLGFLAARNLMQDNPISFAVYVVVRTVLSIVRSIEPLIIAIVFVVAVGLGPFAGMMAIMLHSVAALAKLYSEVIESIEPGPIEAVRATGASWAETVRYGVIPQVIPSFTAFTLYRWDINVRSSIVVGFVGGGGIGAWLFQWIQVADYRAVGAAFIAIVLVVMVLDQASARLRERII